MAAFRRVVPDHGLPIPSEDAVQRAIGIANPDFHRDTVYNMEKLADQ